MCSRTSASGSSATTATTSTRWRRCTGPTRCSIHRGSSRASVLAVGMARCASTGTRSGRSGTGCGWTLLRFSKWATTAMSWWWSSAGEASAAGRTRDTGRAVSQENVEIVRSFYDAWAREEFPGPPELMDPEIEYVNPSGAVEPGTRHGLDAFHREVEKVFEGWATWQMEPEVFEAAGDQV